MNTATASLLVLASAAPALLADINIAPPATPTPHMPTRVQGNCDLLASNTIRATYHGVQQLQRQTLDQSAPTTVYVAVFEVIENLAYNQYVRYGDGELVQGSRFTVALSREIPGQPAEIVDTIFAMQPGEEALLKIDHLYIYGGQEGTSVRPCSRMVRRAAVSAMPTPAPTPGAEAPAPQQPQQPAPDAAAPQQPAPHIPAPAVKPIAEVTTLPPADADREDLEAWEKDHDDDTTVETAPQNEAPIPSPVVPEDDVADTEGF